MKISLPGFISALPDFALGGLFFYTWMSPMAIDDAMVAHLMLIMLLEFIVVHSSGFMGNVAIGDGPRAKKVTATLGLGAFYTIFVGGFAAAFKTWWPLFAFWGLTFNRLLGLVIGQAPQGEEKELVRKGWAIGAILYLLLVFATTLLPVPELGIARISRGALNLPGGGLWVDDPHRVIAFGAFYFTFFAVSEMCAHAWLPSSGLPDHKRGIR